MIRLTYLIISLMQSRNFFFDEILIDKTGIEQSDKAIKTVAGYFLENFGKIPRVNDKIIIKNHELSIKAMDGLRIAKLSLIHKNDVKN